MLNRFILDGLRIARFSCFPVTKRRARFATIKGLVQLGAENAAMATDATPIRDCPWGYYTVFYKYAILQRCWPVRWWLMWVSTWALLVAAALVCVFTGSADMVGVVVLAALLLLASRYLTTPRSLIVVRLRSTPLGKGQIVALGTEGEPKEDPS
jgi:hypothetical protein